MSRLGYRPIRLTLLMCLAVGCIASKSPGDPWLGAEEVLKRLADNGGMSQEGSSALSDRERLAADIKQYAQAAEGLESDDAADQWLGLLDRVLALSEGAGIERGYQYVRRAHSDGTDFKRMIQVIPPPASWDRLYAGIYARLKPDDQAGGLVRYHALRLWAGFLIGNEASITGELASLADVVSSDSEGSYSDHSWQLRRLIEVFSQAGDDPQRVVDQLELLIAKAEAGGGGYGFDIPDLVTLLGPKRAEQLLRRIMVLDVEDVEIDLGVKTKALARRIALEEIDNLKQPRWELVDTIDAVALYEALAGKFLPEEALQDKTPQKSQELSDPADSDAPGQQAEALIEGADPDDNQAASGKWVITDLSGFARSLGMQIDFEEEYGDSPYDSWAYQSARQFYVLGLIAQGRPADARLEIATRRGEDAWSLEIPYGGLRALDEAGFTEAVFEFLHLLLTEDPALPVWEAYTELAVRARKSPQMLVLARASYEREGLSATERDQIEKTLIMGLLAADHLEEALGMIKADAAGDNPSFNSLQRMINIGIAIGDKDLVSDAIAPLNRLVMNEDRAVSHDSDAVATLVRAHKELGQLSQAEHVLFESMTKVSRQKGDTSSYGGYGYGYMYGGSSGSLSGYLSALVSLYDQAGRHRDVLMLLDQSPDWGVKGISDVRIPYAWRSDRKSGLALYAARALHVTGRSAQAQAIVRAELENHPGSDRAYELLIDIMGQDAIGILDVEFGRDRFEERPLIWKAQLLIDSGRIDEAEQVIKHAISIDPSDGEQGRGDRMRAYRVLAQVSKARGDQEQVDFFSRVDDAIRLSEDADRVYSAGLIKRSIEMYRRSLDSFADAYCIQSRLAIQLSQAGRYDEAERHYQRAYELMPDSFGRVESHCFGCEGVFGDKRAVGVAERVFTRLVNQTPDKPQVHYLLGYLRYSHDEDKQAAEHFLKAVELDPDYLNAWKKLASTAGRIHLPQEVRDRAAINIVRLDPLGRHSGNASANVVNLRALWAVLEDNQRFHHEQPEVVYSLEASVARIEQVEKLTGETAYQSDPYAVRDKDAATPGQVLANHSVFEAVAGMIDGR